MTLLSKARARARQLNIKGKIELSDKKGKKLKITLENGKVVHFGSDVSNTYLDHGDEKKRNAYRARHSKIKLKDGTRAIDKPYSPAWLSMRILWT